MTRRFAALAFVCLLAAVPAYGQTVAAEVSQSVGVSTEDIAGAGTQARVLGETASGLRLQLEGAWGARSTESESDVFGTAYPYEGGFQVIEAYGEYLFAPRQWVRSVKGGRYRTPFGIYAASDHAYIGFLRPPADSLRRVLRAVDRVSRARRRRGRRRAAPVGRAQRRHARRRRRGHSPPRGRHGRAR